MKKFLELWITVKILVLFVSLFYINQNYDNILRQHASKVLSIRSIFIFYQSFASKNDLHHDKAEILSFLARLIMHWYFVEDAFHRTFTLCSETQY